MVTRRDYTGERIDAAHIFWNDKDLEHFLSRWPERESTPDMGYNCDNCEMRPLRPIGNG